MRIAAGFVLSLTVVQLTASAAHAAVVVSSDATKNIACSAGTCMPTRAKAVLNVTQLTNMLVDEDITIGTSAKAPDIRIEAPFSWTSDHRLTLQGTGNIEVNRHVSDAGNGAIILVARTGTLSFGNKGSISFLGVSNPLTINGKNYLLAADIQTLAQLIARNPSGNFALAHSYDAKPDGKYRQSPISTVFQGNFEGLGNGISNLHVECVGCGGLFQAAASNAHIGNVNMASVVVDVTLQTGSETVSAGGLVGVNQGTISGSQIAGKLSLTCSSASAGWSELGGLVGENDGTIFNAVAKVAVSDGSLCLADLGGLVGDNYGGITYGVASGAVTGHVEDDAGGLVGDDWLGTIKLSNALGPVTGYRAGGLAGFSEAYILDSSAAGPATGVGSGSVAGGFVGLNMGLIQGESCTAGGAVSAKLAAGGFIGANYYPVQNCVSYGEVTGAKYVGGFVGQDKKGSFSNDGWDMTTSGITDPSQGAGNVPNDPGITGFN